MRLAAPSPKIDPAMRSTLEPHEIRFLLVRHGETESNVARTYTGWTNTPLSPRGREQAQAVAERLASFPVSAVYASDLDRAAQTAAGIASAHGLPMTLDPRLRERNYGLLEGMEFRTACERFPELFPEPDRYATDGTLPEGESVADVRERVASFVDEAIHHGRGRTIVVVSHAGVLRMFLGALLDLPRQAIRGVCCDNTSLSAFRHGRHGWQLELWNDTAHLDGRRAE